MVGPRGPPAQPVFGPAHTITGAYSKHPNTTPTRDSVRVATVPFAFSTCGVMIYGGGCASSPGHVRPL